MPYLYARQNPLDSARNTFSSWDNCMAKTYCKWPVIVAIIIGSLIVISVVTCIARCICCGAECAICCCKCCTCCCSGGGGRSGHKRMKSEPAPSYPVYPTAGQPNPYAQANAAAPPAPINQQPFSQQYRSHAAPAFTPAPAPLHEAPQFATFDSQKKSVNEDSLPAMPSWGDARDVHVQVEEPAVPEKRGDVEMDRLNHSGSMTSNSMAAVGGARRSPGPNRPPMQRSPTGDSYGYDQGFEHEPLVGNANMQRSPHASSGPYGNNSNLNRPYGQQDDYRRGSPAQNLSPVYGAGEGYSRRSPQPQHQPYHDAPSPVRSPYADDYDQPSTHQNTSYTSMPQHPAPARYDSPSPPSYHTNAGPTAPYDTYASTTSPLNTQPNRSHIPSHDTPEPVTAPSPVSAYPGQRSYTPQSSYPGQQTYQAFNPGQTGQQYTGVARKAVDGSYRDL